MKESLLKKKQKLRNNEYYNMQETFDDLYKMSCDGIKFNNLIQLIKQDENILLAYRNIKKNHGSVTAGTDGLNIEFIRNMGIENYIKYIQNKFDNYFPKSVRRVDIPKGDGKTRPLGIPCIDDRVIQQCIKQILEPICEAKFHKHSYGFRPNRSTEHAIARSMFLMNRNGLHYVVDIDIKGFFTNVNHNKLKKQLWNMGIKDKQLLSIIGKILESEIEGEGIPTKGTPQGGIISPLLSNVVLNELDWWISSQWETFETRHDYIAQSDKYRTLKKTKMKEMFLVRYADDFKIFCRDYKTAVKAYNAVKTWLKERLDLDISPTKSKITNVRKGRTEFLGFRLNVVNKGKKLVCNSRMTQKAVVNTVNKLVEQVKVIQKKQNSKKVTKLNSMILGSHNYYNKATHCVMDFSLINFLVTKTLDNRLKGVMSNKPRFSKTYNKLYGSYQGKIRTVQNITLFPIYACKTKNAMCMNTKVCNYTKAGRKIIHDSAKGYNHIIEHLLNNSDRKKSVEFNDNSISLIVGQRGKCYVTREQLEIGKLECHHKRMQSKGGTDEYKNLTWLSYDVHKLVHCIEEKTIDKYMTLMKIEGKGLEKVNSLRKLVGNSEIKLKV
ncbi:group II intron reverse transcriptase/maturase [Clostridium sp.]|uniref:group II intron reverse transcriptase/maturase n=1 Tax=Clostridium sp. TaxID=1506 RepID=UPI003D6D3A7B